MSAGPRALNASLAKLAYNQSRWIDQQGNVGSSPFRTAASLDRICGMIASAFWRYFIRCLWPSTSSCSPPPGTIPSTLCRTLFLFFGYSFGIPTLGEILFQPLSSRLARYLSLSRLHSLLIALLRRDTRKLNSERSGF
jgi:hypothetical protein